MRTPSQAVAYADVLAHSSSPPFTPGHCLAFAVQCYQVAGSSPDATQAWNQTQYRDTSTPPPLGALLWWTGGEQGHGHVALATGDGGCYSTDFSDTGYVGDGRVRRLLNARNIDARDPLLHWQGWSRDLEGSVVVPKEDWLDMATQAEVTQAFYDALTRWFHDHGAQLFQAATGAANTLIPNPAASLSYPTHNK